jgi:hypothetical protein
LNSERDYRAIVEQGGAVYIGRRASQIVFRAPDSDEELRLFLTAMTVENVRLSLKAAHERHNAIHEWQEVNESEREKVTQ